MGYIEDFSSIQEINDWLDSFTDNKDSEATYIEFHVGDLCKSTYGYKSLIGDYCGERNTLVFDGNFLNLYYGDVNGYNGGAFGISQGVSKSSDPVEVYLVIGLKVSYKEVENPYVINPIKKNYKAKADINTAMVDLTYYARNHIQDYQNITEIPQENLNYLNSGLVASNMSGMFNGCNELQSVPKLNIDTSQCIDTHGMFYDCYALTSLDLSNWDTSNVTSMSAMFCYCYALTTIDLSSFNTSKVTVMRSMFYYCQALEHIEGIIDMKSCTDYSNMFLNCPKLSGVKIKNPPGDFESKTKLNSSQYEIVS